MKLLKQGSDILSGSPGSIMKLGGRGVERVIQGDGLCARDVGSLDQGGGDKDRELLIDLLLCMRNRFTIYL